MNDVIVKIGGSLIQHGKFNNRINLIKLDPVDFPGIITDLDSLAQENQYYKIVAKVPAAYANRFFAAGYTIEGYIPGLYRGNEYGLILAKFFHEIHLKIPKNQLLELDLLFKRIPLQAKTFLDDRYIFKKLDLLDVTEMATLYREIFDSYPFPIHQPEYLLKVMQENTIYFGIWEQQKLIALASSEIDLEGQYVEMTDFSVLPDYRGQQLALFLLNQMEFEMKNLGLKTAFSIARLNSVGINVTFHKAGYHYGGTLINNTNICGSIENMNIWYKSF